MSRLPVHREPAPLCEPQPLAMAAARGAVYGAALVATCVVLQAAAGLGVVAFAAAAAIGWACIWLAALATHE